MTYFNKEKQDIRYIIYFLYTEYNIKKNLQIFNPYINNYIIAACAIKNYIEITNNKRKRVKITKNLLINLFNYVKFEFNYEIYKFIKDKIYKYYFISKKSRYYLN